MLEIEEQSVQFRSRARGSAGSFTSLTLAAVSVFFQADRGQHDNKDARRDCDAYLGLNMNPEPSSGVNQYTLFNQDLLLVQAADSYELLVERRNDKRALVKETGCALMVFKKCCVDLAQQLTGKVEEALRKP